MSVITKTAAKRNRLSLLHLFHSTKRTVYFICSQLLDSGEVSEAVARIYELAWNALADQPEARQNFKQYMTHLSLSFCRERILEKRPDAFSETAKAQTPPLRLPKEGDCADFTPVCIHYALAKLPVFHRFALLLKLVAGEGSAQIAETMQISEMDAHVTINHAEDSIRETLQFLKDKTDRSLTSYEQFRGAVQHQLSHLKLPEETAQPIIEKIALIAAPPSKKKWFLLGPIFLILLVLALTPVAKTLLQHLHTTYAEIEVQDYGSIRIALNEEAAPETVANFISLAESGFYDGLTFHRVVAGFMIQGGDPNGDSTGGSDQTITGEFSANGIENPLSHTRGTVSMARMANDYNSASSQFFIMQADYPELDGQYAAFGQVVSGMEVVDEICATVIVSTAQGQVLPENQPVITSITIEHAKLS